MPASPSFMLPACLLAAALLSPAPAAEFTVSTAVDSGPGSLRQAILEANAAPGSDTILFTLDRSWGAFAQITVAGALPDITDPVIIQGSYNYGQQTQINAVEITSTGLTAGQSLLTVTSGGSSLRNLILISNTPGAVGLTLNGGGGNTLDGLQVGLSAAKQIPSAALHGIVVASDDNIMTDCFVGGALAGDGLRITGSRNLFKLGFCGTKPGRSNTGMGAKNNTGIHLLGGSGNVVDFISASSIGVVIGNFVHAGIHIEGGTGHRIVGNWLAGSSSSTGTTGMGIRIDGGASQIEIEKTQFRSINGTSIAIPGPASHVRISGVLIDYGTSHGISVGTGVTDLLVEDTVIGSAGGAGIHLEGESTSSSGPVFIRHNTIYRNKVGIDVVSGMGQVTIGTRRDSALPCSNIIWGDRDGAILVRDPAARVRISENAMQPISETYGTPNEYAIPINLKPDGEAAGAVTDNDPLDGDSGPNGIQNKPVITGLEALSGSEIRITGSLSAKPSTTYVIEAIQHTAELVGPLYGEFTAGYLGSHSITTDPSGTAPFSMQVSGYVAGWNTALTATSPDGETSEYSNVESTGFPPPLFPLLGDQTSFLLPENQSETGSAFSLVRTLGITGAFDASISAHALYTMDSTHPAPRIPLKYRFAPTDAWTMLGWETPLTIPFSASDNERVIYLAAYDDTSWDPANKPGYFSVYSGPGSIGKMVPLQFPDNDPPPVFVMEIVSPVPRPPIPGIPDLLPGIFEGYPEDGIFFSIRADRPVSENMNYSISVNSAQSTATPNVDFSAPPANLMIFEASLIGRSCVVFLTNDQLIENDEIMAFNIVSTTAGVAYSSVATITLKDNDFYQTSIADASVLEGNAGTILLTFPITISQARPADVTFDWVAAPGTAVSPSDFTAASGTVTIPAGATGTTIQIEVNGDTSVEANGTFTLTLSNPSASDVRLADATAVGTITNDDFPSVSVAGATVSEAAGSITLTATLSGAAPFAASVGYTLVNGTAIRSSDYTGTVSGTLNFPAGSTTAILSLTILNDTTDEPDETFSVQLGNPSGLTPGTSTATITIVDNDAPILLTPSVVNLVEGDSGSQTIPVTLTLKTPAIRAGSLYWQVTADSTGVEAASGTVTFAPGASTANLALTLAGNLIPQATRSVKLQLSSPVEVSLPASIITVATITDNDQRAITGHAVSLAEGNGGTTIALFPVSISAPLEVPVTVQYQTANGSALAGSDYTAANGTATIPAGATEVTIPITVLADTTLELTETFTVLLSSPVNATLATAILTGTIQNDDDQPVLQISPATVTAGPGGPFLAWIEIKLPEASTSLGFPVAYAVATRNGTALAGTDYTAITGGVLTFPAGNGTPASLWITVSVAGNQNTGGGPTQFHVDFTPLTGPASILSTEVKIEPLRVTSFSRIGLGFYTVSFPTGIAQNYVIQQATSLAGPWSDKTSVIPGTGNPVDEFLLFASQSRAYFRVRSFTTPPATPANLGSNP